MFGYVNGYKKIHKSSLLANVIMTLPSKCDLFVCTINQLNAQNSWRHTNSCFTTSCKMVGTRVVER